MGHMAAALQTVAAPAKGTPAGRGDVALPWGRVRPKASVQAGRSAAWAFRTPARGARLQNLTWNRLRARRFSESTGNARGIPNYLCCTGTVVLLQVICVWTSHLIVRTLLNANLG